MGKKYVVTIMDRHYLGEDSFIYSCNHVTIGELEEETEIFTDSNGNQYGPMLNPN